MRVLRTERRKVSFRKKGLQLLESVVDLETTSRFLHMSEVLLRGTAWIHSNSPREKLSFAPQEMVSTRDVRGPAPDGAPEDLASALSKLAPRAR